MYLLGVHPGQMRALRMVSGAESDGIMVISAVVEINVQSCSCRAKNKFDSEILHRRRHPLLCVAFVWAAQAGRAGHIGFDVTRKQTDFSSSKSKIVETDC